MPIEFEMAAPNNLKTNVEGYDNFGYIHCG